MTENWINISKEGQPKEPGMYIAFWKENGRDMVHEVCFNIHNEWQSIAPLYSNMTKLITHYTFLPIAPKEEISTPEPERDFSWLKPGIKAWCPSSMCFKREVTIVNVFFDTKIAAVQTQSGIGNIEFKRLFRKEEECPER